MHAAIQVALVSDQPTPNLTPVLDPAFRPRALMLVVSPDKRTQARWLAEALRDTGVAVEEWPIDDAWNIEHIRDRLLDLVIHLDGQSMALNVTGGTKPMAIAAYEVFRDHAPIFYVHPETDHLVWLHHPDQPPSRDLADRVKLDRFLLAHGASVTGKGSALGVPEHLRALTAELIRGIADYQKALATLNWYAQSAEGRLLSDPIKADVWRDPAFQTLLDRFIHAGILHVEEQRLRFPDEDSRFYANGGWLESHVWGICLQLKKETGIQDIARGVKVKRNTQGNKKPGNELDIVFLRNNRLHVIECKTRRFDDPPDGASRGAEALYKLDALADLFGGLKAKALLVSYRTLNETDRQRARQHRVEIYDGEKLKDLLAHLKRWIVER
ncbi:MAG TPA: DUF1887 family CARF protein [Methylococcus sp.]|nr:DUF1887 family CARF protein [Methylococcus sp.]